MAPQSDPSRPGAGPDRQRKRVPLLADSVSSQGQRRASQLSDRFEEALWSGAEAVMRRRGSTNLDASDFDEASRKLLAPHTGNLGWHCAASVAVFLAAAPFTVGLAMISAAEPGPLGLLLMIVAVVLAVFAEVIRYLTSR